MRKAFVVVLALGVLAVAAPAGDDPEPPQKAAGKLVGAWELTEIKFQGVAVPLPGNDPMTFTFNKNGTLSTSGQGQKKDGKWKVNAKKTPGELDMTDGNMTTGMIYKLEKDVLTIGAAQGPNGPRPKDFASAPATMVFKRKKK